jgi:hypothetical protein
LDGVSCPRAGFCIAVGGYRYGSGCTQLLPPCSQGTIIVGWTGRRWRELPTPPGVAGLNAVSCSSSRSCFAVGGQCATVSGGIGCVVSERWDGRRWSLQATPSIPGDLFGVACVSPRACTAVGFRPAPHRPSVQASLAEGWNGSKWTVERFQVRGDLSWLDSVSCTLRRACTAVSGQPYRPRVQRWNGTTWRVQPSPRTISLASVSCSSAVRCVAIGEKSPSGLALAEAWNGARWSIMPTP